MISQGDRQIHELIADAADWRLGELQDSCHWAASEKESSDCTKDRGPRGTAEGCVKGLLTV
jgi:hypothetical protein